jgi:hypothetical protein
MNFYEVYSKQRSYGMQSTKKNYMQLTTPNLS